MITSKSSNSKKKMMFLTDSKDINFYLNNYLSNNSNTGEIDRSVLKGGLDVKTQFANEININGNKFKLRYLVIREIIIDRKKKFFIEFYKDESFAKLKFIIDTDNIEQIDLKEKENSIYLKHDQTKEMCQIKCDDKRLLQKWLSALCKNCGFNEIKMRADVSKSNSNLVNRTPSSDINNNNINHKSTTSAKQTTSSTRSNFYNLFKPTQTQKQQLFQNENIPQSISPSPKPIAGVAALSVGSFDLCNSTLSSLFHNGNNKENNKIEQTNDGYLQLEECLSGVDEEETFISNLSRTNRNSDIQPDKKAMNSNNIWSSYHSEVNLNNNSIADNRVVFKKSMKRNSLIQNHADSSKQVEYLNELKDQRTNNDDYYVNKSLRYVPLEVLTNRGESQSVDDSSNTDNSLSKNKNTTSSVETSTRRLSHISTKEKRIENPTPSSFYTDWDAVRTKALQKTLANANKAV